MTTHIQTLADNTAKSRRRVRRTLGMKAGELLALPRTQAETAQDIARRRELAGAEKDATKCAAAKGGAK